MKYCWPLFAVGIFTTLIACSSNTRTEKTVFTKADSVTDTYLVLQDSLLQTWNVLVNEENEKINSLNALLDHLMAAGDHEKSMLTSLNNRLDQLRKIRITQKTLGNPYVVEEYDFASNSITTEILSIAEGGTVMIQNSKIVTLVDKIKLAETRMEVNRSLYDSVALTLNAFLDKHGNLLREVDKKSNLEKKPLFKAASDMH